MRVHDTCSGTRMVSWLHIGDQLAESGPPDTDNTCSRSNGQKYANHQLRSSPAKMHRIESTTKISTKTRQDEQQQMVAVVVAHKSGQHLGWRGDVRQPVAE
uniref:Uncharacterized protein n=1 Tax=Eutreptiella gymnastica TaxID=73025 RepID=A0A7S4GEP9_9EUGL